VAWCTNVTRQCLKEIWNTFTYKVYYLTSSDQPSHFHTSKKWLNVFQIESLSKWRNFVQSGHTGLVWPLDLWKLSLWKSGLCQDYHLISVSAYIRFRGSDTFVVSLVPKFESKRTRIRDAGIKWTTSQAVSQIAKSINFG
jgi:hypothetical protein